MNKPNEMIPDGWKLTRLGWDGATWICTAERHPGAGITCLGNTIGEAIKACCDAASVNSGVSNDLQPQDYASICDGTEQVTATDRWKRRKLTIQNWLLAIGIVFFSVSFFVSLAFIIIKGLK